MLESGAGWSVHTAAALHDLHLSYNVYCISGITGICDRLLRILFHSPNNCKRGRSTSSSQRSQVYFDRSCKRLVG